MLLANQSKLKKGKLYHTDQDNFIVIIGGDTLDQMIPEMLHQPDMKKFQNLPLSRFFGILKVSKHGH